MTSYITPERKLAPFKNAFDKLNPTQTKEKLLLLELAAYSFFSQPDLTQKVISEIGLEEMSKISMEEFLSKVGAEVEKLPKREFKIFTDI